MIRATFFLSGRVQGVGMRFAVYELAKQFEVTGTVENLDDGRVKVVAEGEKSELDRFELAFKSISRGHIQSVERFECLPNRDFDGFSIKRF